MGTLLDLRLMTDIDSRCFLPTNRPAHAHRPRLRSSRDGDRCGSACDDFSI